MSPINDFNLKATNIDSLRKVSARGGKEYWRGLEELADTPEFREYLKEEFPNKHEMWEEPVSRRYFLKIMGASMAMVLTE